MNNFCPLALNPTLAALPRQQACPERAAAPALNAANARRRGMLAEAQAVFENTVVARDFDAWQVKRDEVTKVES